MSELKPCPFCGAENTDVGFIAHTNECYLMLRYMGEYSKKELGNAWNTRPIEDALQAEIDRLKEDLAETQACLLERNIQLDVERRSHRWIPVSERLPNRDGFYLILENVNQVAGYYHWCKQFGWNTDGGRIHIQTVTHWMPLPPPPEGEA